RRHGRGGGGQPRDVHLPAGRPPDADRAGEGPDRERGCHAASRAVHPGPGGVGDTRGAGGPGAGGVPHQRPVLRVRGRGRGGLAGGEAAAPEDRRDRGQRLRGAGGDQARRPRDRLRHPVPARRRAREAARLMFVDFFIRRPIFATVCALLIILAGAVAIPTLPIAQFPALAPPQVTVLSNYIGASAQAVESAVTIPLEQQINGAQDLKYLTSTSGNDGTSAIVATFDLGRDPDLAAVDIQNRVSIAQGRLPNEVKQTGVTVIKSASNFVFGAAVYSEGGRYDTTFMSNYLDTNVRDALKRVKGVADVFIFGVRRYATRRWLSPVRVAGRGLTASDVVAALREQNMQVAAGQVGQQPAPP